MNRAVAVRWSVAMALAGLAILPAAGAPTAQDILKKSQELMKNARSYQATLHMTTNVAGMTPKPVETTVDIKVIPGKKMAATLKPMGMQMVDDGTNMYVYMPAMKQYQKGPTQGAKAQIGLPTLDQLVKNSTMKMMPSANVGGVRANVVQVIRKSGTATATLLIYSDPATGKLLKVDTKQSMPGPQGTRTLTQTIVLTNQVFNANIPASVFKFVPPPGATQMKAPTGMPGMGGPPHGAGPGK